MLEKSLDGGFSQSWETKVHASSHFGGPSAELHYPPDLKLEPVHLDITHNPLSLLGFCLDE